MQTLLTEKQSRLPPFEESAVIPENSRHPFFPTVDCQRHYSFRKRALTIPTIPRRNESKEKDARVPIRKPKHRSAAPPFLLGMNGMASARESAGHTLAIQQPPRHKEEANKKATAKDNAFLTARNSQSLAEAFRRFFFATKMVAVSLTPPTPFPQLTNERNEHNA